jgi:PAS domain S-box-containing protein
LQTTSFLPPTHHFYPLGPHEFALLALFIIVGISISVLQSALAKTNDALRSSREQIRLAAEAGRIGFGESLGDDHIAWSPEMERLFGIEPGTFEGNLAAWVRRIHPNDRERFVLDRRTQIERHVASIKYEYRACVPDGQIRWLEERCHLVFSTAGSLGRVVSASVDITDRHELEQTLTARAQKLNESNHELEQFAYKVTHELQGPVRTVEKMAQLLQKRWRTEAETDSMELLDLITRNAQRLRRRVASCRAIFQSA